MTDQPTPLTDAEIAAIRERVDAATPGPWGVINRGGGGIGDYAFGNDVTGPPEPYARGMFEKADDAEFIAASRTDIPRLLATIDALKAERDAVNAAIGREVELADQSLRRAVAAEARVARLEDALGDMTSWFVDFVDERDRKRWPSLVRAHEVLGWPLPASATEEGAAGDTHAASTPQTGDGDGAR